MTRIGTWTAAGALLALAACQGTQMGGDAGPDDAGPTDAGPGDAGAPVCSVSTGERIPERCLPRCTAETQECLAGCGEDAECRDACAASDATPPMMADREGGSTFELDCARCLLWPGTTCARDLCPVEFEACASCDAGFCSESACQPEYEQLRSCVGDHAADYLTCIEAESVACFP